MLYSICLKFSISVQQKNLIFRYNYVVKNLIFR